jgi:hypothetical protein
VPCVPPGHPPYCRAGLKETMEPAVFGERHAKLPPRQDEVLLLPVQGTTNEEVVRQLLLRERTIEKSPDPEPARPWGNCGRASVCSQIRTFRSAIATARSSAGARVAEHYTPPDYAQLSRGRGRFLGHQNRSRRRGDP